ncbi:hypothetical protein E2C01_032925 [Portunus trituberculatus]|uniref:Uncharacterized protein n=1 Tax=Portunus trituberculatus TaxID=210409 RepID=A0A5B7EWH4_PORTR|nr:hypothetical protein [Portunus trituberculatus]
MLRVPSLVQLRCHSTYCRVNIKWRRVEMKPWASPGFLHSATFLKLINRKRECCRRVGSASPPGPWGMEHA